MNADALAHYRSAVAGARFTRQVGRVRQVHALGIEVTGLQASMGEQCTIRPPAGATNDTNVEPLLAEVVRINTSSLLLMPFGPVRGLRAGFEVMPLGGRAEIGVGPQLLGRVIDGFGQPLDGLPAPAVESHRELQATPLQPMQRPRLTAVLETGIRAIDGLLTIARGQRVGLFAGSGVGKSTLLGMIAGHAQADVNVIALIGERGRELREFIEKHLGAEGLRRSVVVAATSDQPTLARIRAAYAAVSIAEHYRDGGQHVLLMMDSVTRLAMARREAGLAAGEPPTARGYTPSVFAELPQLCERCGTAAGGGSITALMTVLVEGDDMNEPVSDHLRATLDGHIVLSRELAHASHYPAIDVLRSASRAMPDVVGSAERKLIAEATRILAVLDRSRQAVEIGVYEPGTSPELDAALALQPALTAWLVQHEGGASRPAALEALAKLLVAARKPPEAAAKARRA